MTRQPSRASTRTTQLVEALRRSGDELASHLWSCAENRKEKSRLQVEGWTTAWCPRCDRLACHSCRRRIVNREKSETKKLFEGFENSDCSMETVMLNRVADLKDMQDVIKRFRAKFRHLRDRMARTSAGWNRLTVTGYIEIDVIETDRLGERPERVRAVTAALPAIGEGPTTWVPHVHLAIHHMGVDRAALKEALSHDWPGRGRVDVRSFKSKRSAPDNAGNISGYGLKHLHETVISTHVVEIDGEQHELRVAEPWPVHLSVSYWRWMEEVRDGARLLRVRLDPVGSRRARASSKRLPKVPGVEPMPMAFCISTT